MATRKEARKLWAAGKPVNPASDPEKGRSPAKIHLLQTTAMLNCGA